MSPAAGAPASAPATAKAGPAAAAGGGGSKTKAPSKKSSTPAPPPKKKKKSSGSSSSRRKKSSSGGGSSSGGAAAAQRAAQARRDLASMKAESDAHKRDAAWQGSEDVAHAGAATLWTRPTSSMTSGGMASSGASIVGGAGLFLNDEILIVDNALRANGLGRDDITPRAYGCLLEQARRYALELVADAQDYAYHSNRHEINGADLRLASEMREDNSVTSCLPPPNQIYDLAEEVNRVPLPPIPAHCYNGVILPPIEHQLTARTFDVVSSAGVAQKMMQGGSPPPPVTKVVRGAPSSRSSDAATGGTGRGGGTKKKTAASYGAHRGRQIAVNLKSRGSEAPAARATGGASVPATGTLVGAGAVAPSVPPVAAPSTPGTAALQPHAPKPGSVTGVSSPASSAGSNVGGGATKRKASDI